MCTTAALLLALAICVEICRELAISTTNSIMPNKLYRGRSSSKRLSGQPAAQVQQRANPPPSLPPCFVTSSDLVLAALRGQLTGR